MAEITKVIIGIQARSTSDRLPNKGMAMIGGKPMIQHVVDACKKAAHYTNHKSHRNDMMVQIFLLIPTGDPLKEHMHGKVNIFEGPEHDVLARYQAMADRFSPDYVVRVTGDCPLIPPFLITKHIKTAVMNRYDYCSNVTEGMRTAPDGFDCEVFSKAMLQYASVGAQEPRHREHVTLYMRENPPNWAKFGAVTGYLNLADLKLSVDTLEDLERVRNEYERIKLAEDKAEAIYGRTNTHKF